LRETAPAFLGCRLSRLEARVPRLAPPFDLPVPPRLPPPATTMLPLPQSFIGISGWFTLYTRN
jgi:hypothetical protein